MHPKTGAPSSGAALPLLARTDRERCAKRGRFAVPLAVAAAVVLGCGAGGCSTSIPLSGASLGGAQASVSVGPTGSIPASAAAATAEEPTPADLALAKSAAVKVLAGGGKDASQPWENPRTGARGTVTPIATAYAQAGTTCRDFLASYVRGSRQSWYQGGACRNGSGWEVREMRPLER